MMPRLVDIDLLEDTWARAAPNEQCLPVRIDRV
jgi:hypothetical protein